MVKAAVIGKDGRTSAITRTLQASPRITGAVRSLSTWSGKPRAVALAEVLKSTEEYRPDFVFVGPEDPLEAGVVDELEKRGIPCVGPGRVLAGLIKRIDRGVEAVTLSDPDSIRKLAEASR